MNYTSAALGVIAVISLLTWITTGRRNFTPPAMNRIKRDESSDSSIKDGKAVSKEAVVVSVSVA